MSGSSPGRFAVWMVLLVLALPLARAEAQTLFQPAESTTRSGSDESTGIAIPKSLEPWVPWVLEQGPNGLDRRACPLDARGVNRLCAWPGLLQLELDAGGGRFEQVWELKAEDWIALPGDVDLWPQDVRADDVPLPVVARDGRPAAQLPAGRHRLTGRFQWRERPESLPLPPETGLLTLALDGRAPISPRLDRDARLWLRDSGQTRADGEGDRLRLEVYRRLDDDLPLRILTRLELEVSGRAREIQLGPVLLPAGIPSNVVSPLPTRLEPDGTLRVQVRPGRWVLEVASHHPGAVAQLARPADPAAPWPEREVWAFAAQPERRRVELSGLERLDPSQTGLPGDWARLPVYAAGPGAVLTFTQQGRGDTDPEPDRLRLAREIWLDFDGQGYSARDRLDGDLTRSWRLEVTPGLDLGQARVDDEPVLITRLDADSPPGVEVRRGRLDLVADSRLDSTSGWIPASGWSLTLDGATSRLHLPPGWDLLAVSGVDNRPDTWLTRWTLLDLFLVLILALGVGRLWGLGWGALALVTLALTWLEPGAPRLVWLHLLAAAALLRLLPDQSESRGLARWRTFVLWYRRLAVLALLAIGLPFLVSEVRSGLYPQLAQPYWSSTGGVVGARASAPTFAFEKTLTESDALLPQAEPEPARREGKVYAPSSLASPAAPPPPLERLDPKALVQTGPGIPDWQWRQVDLSWTGPVGPNDGARLWWLTPGWHLVLVIVAGLLLVALGLRLSDLNLSGADLKQRWQTQFRAGAPLSLLALALMLGAALTPRPTLAADFPSPALLDELRTRLLAPPECLPECLTLASLALRAEPERLTLDLTLDAATAMAAEILDARSGWSPSSVVLDGVVLERLRRDSDGSLLIPLDPGRHRLQLTGALGAETRIDLPLALDPRRVEVVAADGWRVEGIRTDGRPGRQIQLIRLASAESEGERPLTQDALPPLLLIERRLAFGLDWRVETRVSRLSAPEFPALVPSTAAAGRVGPDGGPPGRGRTGPGRARSGTDRATLDLQPQTRGRTRIDRRHGSAPDRILVAGSQSDLASGQHGSGPGPSSGPGRALAAALASTARRVPSSADQSSRGCARTHVDVGSGRRPGRAGAARRGHDPDPDGAQHSGRCLQAPVARRRRDPNPEHRWPHPAAAERSDDPGRTAVGAGHTGDAGRLASGVTADTELQPGQPGSGTDGGQYHPAPAPARRSLGAVRLGAGDRAGGAVLGGIRGAGRRGAGARAGASDAAALVRLAAARSGAGAVRGLGWHS
jgi:hypothetical protein